VGVNCCAPTKMNHPIKSGGDDEARTDIPTPSLPDLIGQSILVGLSHIRPLGTFSLMGRRGVVRAPPITYPRPQNPVLFSSHPRRLRGPDAGSGGEDRMGRALPCRGRKLAAGPAIWCRLRPDPLSKPISVTGGLWLPSLPKRSGSKAARYPCSGIGSAPRRFGAPGQEESATPSGRARFRRVHCPVLSPSLPMLR